MSDMKVTVYGENQNVLCKLVAWDAIFGKGGGAIQFSADVTLHAPDAAIGQRDRVVILRVVAAGIGNVSRGSLNPCRLESDDLVVCNLFHQTQEVRLMGDNFGMFNWEHIMAKLDVNPATRSINLIPLQGYIVCQPNERAAQRLMMGASQIVSPYGDAQYSGGAEPEFDPRRPPTEKAKTVIEQCVMVGPGAVVDGLWQTPNPAWVGACVMYDTSVSPVRFVVGGKTFTLVHMRHVLLSFRNEEDSKPIEDAVGSEAPSQVN